MPPHIDSATLDERAEVFGALAAETVQHGPFSGAAAEKDVASEGQHAPGPAGPVPSQTVCFQMFPKSVIHPESSRLKISKSSGGPNYESGLWLAT